MTGPEHYQLAEQLVKTAKSILERATENTYAEARMDASDLVEMAQVHATLALAAATAEPIVTSDVTITSVRNEWGKAIS